MYTFSMFHDGIIVLLKFNAKTGLYKIITGIVRRDYKKFKDSIVTQIFLIGVSAMRPLSKY